MTGKDRVGRHSIGVVSRRTGLRPDVIRAWERRYGAIRPSRTETNRRFYSDADIDRLLLLRRATLAGRQIGQVGGLATDELRELVASDEAAIARVPRMLHPDSANEYSGESHLAACLASIENLDPQGLQYHLERAGIELTPPRVVDCVLVPLLKQVGDMWEKGSLRVSHEHMASAVLSAYLTLMQNSAAPAGNAPPIVVGTPSRQLHELGALIAAATAAAEGWNVIYLGANLPAEELAAAIHQKGARVVALSLVYPGDDALLDRELGRLRRLLGPETEILFGGRSAPSYSATIERINGKLVLDTDELRQVLRKLRS
jgi:MerR family transcriptional regulator, light-induced transcriptional regulator